MPRRLEEIGVDGVFTFEGPHDVFTPLVLAATATSKLELTTNVAIAFPRNPIQLAHQAYDLQLLSGGRFTLGLGTQVRAQVERRYGAAFDRPVARMRELVGRAAGDLLVVGVRRGARVPGRVHLPHVDAAAVQPGSPSLRDATDRARRARPADGAPRRGGCRRGAGHALQHLRALPRAHTAGHRRGPRSRRPGAHRSHRHRRGHRLLRPRRGRARCGPGRRALAGRVLRLDPLLPAGARGRGVGGAAGESSLRSPRPDGGRRWPR